MHPWVPYIFTSAVLLALYDLSKKRSLCENAVMPVLFFATLCGALSFLGFLVLTRRLTVAFDVDVTTAALLLVKAVLVGSSWTFAYFAVRALPISVSAPLRASAPMWTVLGAFAIYQEIPTPIQAVGMAVIFVGYGLFALSGRLEGIGFLRNRGVWCSFAGTLFGSASALYDKHLLQVRAIPRETVQAWFCVGLVAVIGIYWVVLRLADCDRGKFVWRWTIPLVGILLVASDFAYFIAITQTDATVSILSLLRRTSVVITFTAGVFIFHEGNRRGKALALAAIMVGAFLICWK